MTVFARAKCALQTTGTDEDAERTAPSHDDSALERELSDLKGVVRAIESGACDMSLFFVHSLLVGTGLWHDESLYSATVQVKP